MVEKEEKQVSFFSFFQDEESLEEEEKFEKMHFDAEIGQHFMEQLIPEALDHYLGVAEQELEYAEDDEDDDDEDEDDII